MRVLILTQWFTPEPTTKGIEFAKELLDRGHSVQVVTGFPNYPGGKIYRGYRMRLIDRKTIDGVSVIRLPLYPSHDRSALRRIANYASFAIAAAVAAPLVTRRADVAYVYHPPATIGLPALSLRLLRRVPFLLDVQDLWPDTLAATGMVSNRHILGLVGRWMAVLYRYSGRISAISTGFKEELVDRGVPAEKIDVILNWAPEVTSRVTESVRPWRGAFSGRFNVVFAGTMGKAQALHEILGAAALVGERDASVQFVFIGSGIETATLEQAADNMSLENVVFLPRMPFAETAEALEDADVLLVHLRDDPLFAITIPSKTQAYLSAGRPILMAVRGNAAELVERAQAGIRCNPEDPTAIADAVMSLRLLPASERADMGRRGRLFYESQLSLDVAVDQLEASLCAAMGESGAARRRRRQAGARHSGFLATARRRGREPPEEM